MVSYNQEKTEKRVQILWARAREVDFPYGKNGVLHILEDRRITDEKQESFLIVLLTKNKKLDIQKIDYKLKDTVYIKQPFQKILESTKWRSATENCDFIEKTDCEVYREWVSVNMTPELRNILIKLDRHVVYRLYNNSRFYDFDARYSWLPSKDKPLQKKSKSRKKKELDKFLKEFPE